MDQIAEIGIDELERLYVRPLKLSFPYIYRAAMEVHWDDKAAQLFSPKPREWSYVDWYKQIIAAASDEYGVRLVIVDATKFSNVTAELQRELLTVS